MNLLLFLFTSVVFLFIISVCLVNMVIRLTFPELWDKITRQPEHSTSEIFQETVHHKNTCINWKSEGF